ncbi:MAG: sulfatase-like hydrolase/transferase [Gammaproteobacteria bacterium]|nr:sulfatase-like hydrolase/transferase [Gammaproteobacteria bacterium]
MNANLLKAYCFKWAFSPFLILCIFTLNACGPNTNSTETGLAEPLVLGNERPNIIVVLVDDMRWDEIGVADHPYVQTPNIDRIAQEGVQFINAFTVNPLCSPSRAALLTGQHAHYHGITDNLARNELSHELETFPQRLHESGYDTAFIGKWHMGNDDTARPGFNRWVGLRGQGEALDPMLNFDGERRQITGYVTDILHEEAIEFISEDRDTPFMLYLSHKGLHPNIFQADDGTALGLDGSGDAGSGFIAADRHVGMYSDAEPPRRPNYGVVPTDKPALMRAIENVSALSLETVTSDKIIRERQEMLMAIDEGLGDMLTKLEELDQLDNTLVVVLSDHGYWYGEHALGAERRMSYEEGIRIPMVMRYPRKIAAGTRIEQMALTLDLAPTMIEFAGLELEKVRHGRSLVPLTSGEEVDDWRDSFMVEYYTDTVFERMYQMGYKTVRTDRHKYIRYEDLEGVDELYDLEQDPYELRNIINEEGSDVIVEEMNTELDRLISISSR